MNRSTLFLFGSFVLFFNCSVAKGQGCGTTLSPRFSVYYSTSEDSQINIYTSVTIEGYADIFPGPGCNMSIARHSVGAENNLNNVDHWTYSACGCPTCYFSATDHESIVGVPGIVYPFYYDGVSTCSIVGVFFSAGGSPGVAAWTAVQHTYPAKPLSAPCWVSQFFDHVSNGKVHRAQDVVNSNAKNNGGLATPDGTPVYAAESGKVVAVAKGNGPAAQGYPACVTQNGVPAAPANFVKILGTDNYNTVYVHVTPSVAVGVQVSQGQQIGVTDNSGCQSGGHIHMRRTDHNGTPVNFTIPCVNPLPTNNFADGLVDDDVPDNL